MIPVTSVPGPVGPAADLGSIVARGVPVSGSDTGPGQLPAVRAAGVAAHLGHDASLVDGAGTVVVSSAIRASNPEVLRAGELSVPVLHRSAVLAALLAGHRGVAVAGAHGKTTTSAMVAVTLASAGLDPSWAIGGTVLRSAPGPDDPVGGAHAGAGDVMVVEADESDGSFLAYRPEIAVVTNVEPDHLDHYGSREAFERAFVDFAAGVTGTLVTCDDDPGARRLALAAAAAGTRVVRYGTGEVDVRVGEWSPRDGGGTTTLTWAGEASVPVHLAVPGAHNALNAAAAWTVARLLGVDASTAAAGLATFVGTGRRFEQRGVAGGVRVVDDYAHHPTEVAALLRAARTVAGPGRVVVLFQPHLYSRTRAFAAQFAEALLLADEVVVTDVYAAREDPDPDVSGALITDAMGPAARFVPDRVAAAHAAAALARPGDLLLTVGAGDVTALGPVVLADLARAGES